MITYVLDGKQYLTVSAGDSLYSFTVNGPGKYKLRFANVDSRLRVWVNDKAIKLGPDADYTPTEAGTPEGWTEENDVKAPAGIGAPVAISVHVPGSTVTRDTSPV